MTDTTAAAKKPQPQTATPKPVKKRIPWTLTLKIEGDVVKVPEFKLTDWTDVTAPIDLEVTIGKANQRNPSRTRFRPGCSRTSTAVA